MKLKEILETQNFNDVEKYNTLRESMKKYTDFDKDFWKK